MLWWSFACASHGWATGFGMLMLSRFLLGMGEGGGFPAATKAVAEWFPVSERSLAMGIMNAGTALGAVIAPPFIAAVLSFATWRWVFFLAGAAGLALVAMVVAGLPDTRRRPSNAAARRQQASWFHLFSFPKYGVSSERSFSATPPGISICSGFPNTCTTRAASTSRKSAIMPGFPMRPPALDACGRMVFRLADPPRPLSQFFPQTGARA